MSEKNCPCPCHSPKTILPPSEFKPCCENQGKKYKDGKEIPQGRKVGFTGTHRGACPEQLTEAEARLRALREEGFDEFHHGQCIGADEQVAKIARTLGYRVVAHPGLASDPANLMYRSDWDGNAEVLEAKPFIARDHDIVNETEVMLATPVSREEHMRSGTWTTVRYARKKGRKEGETLFVLKPPFTPPQWVRDQRPTISRGEK